MNTYGRASIKGCLYPDPPAIQLRLIHLISNGHSHQKSKVKSLVASLKVYSITGHMIPIYYIFYT